MAVSGGHDRAVHQSTDREGGSTNGGTPTVVGLETCFLLPYVQALRHHRLIHPLQLLCFAINGEKKNMKQDPVTKILT